MNYKKTEILELDEVMVIIEEAREFLKKQGLDQWQNGYPNRETIENDIKVGDSYVWLEENKVIGTAAISFDGEPTYEKIYEGVWKSDQPYGVIHRMAVSSLAKGTGLAVKMMEDAEIICLDNEIHSIKVDTHEDNIPMQKLLKKIGYVYCGVIYLSDGAKRIAFEKLL